MPEDVVDTCRFALAQALWASSVDASPERARARELTAQARDGYAGMGEGAGKTSSARSTAGSPSMAADVECGTIVG